MGKKTKRVERFLTPSAEDVVVLWRRHYGSLKLALSVAVMGLKHLTTKQRELALAEANSMNEQESRITEEQFYWFAIFYTKFESSVEAGRCKRQKILKDIEASTTLLDDQKKALRLAVQEFAEALKGKKHIPPIGFLEP